MGKVQVEADIPQVVNYVATTVNVGATTTLPSGSDATVTNSGTESNVILNFGIPKGADGADGQDGKSAYEQAVEGGYQGTEEEFEQALASDIATVASNISDVNAVGQSIADVNSVADSLTDISTVATNVSDVNTVAGISSDVTSVASISSAVGTVASHDTEVLLVSDNMASVMTTASNITNVNTVAGISSDVTAVASNATDISAVAANNSNITSVAGNATNINAVNSNKTNIDAVAGNATNINSIAADLTNIDTAATNIAAIIAAPTAATNAATSATNAQKWAEGTDSQVTPLGGEHSAKGWANVAKQYAESIGAALKYKGSVSTYSALPSTGQQTGDFWNVLDTGKNYAWTGTEWDDVSGIMDLSAYRTAAAQDVIDSGKQATLVSGTNIKTVNNNSLLGSGNISIDSLPSQSGQSGKFLTTDGTDASWASVSVPANVYTQDNLVAGTNISLTEQTISGGIDEHTLALFHVEENWTDSSQYASTGFGGYGQTNGCSFVDARFGKGAKKRATSNFFNSAFQNISTAFTIDFWAKIAWNEIVKVNLCYNVYGTEAGYLRISRSQADIPSQSSTDIYVRLMAAGVETSPILIQNAIDINDFNHYAFCVDTTTQSIKLFINGVEKYSTATTSSIPTFTTNPYFYFDSGANFSETIIDEFRISNVARYTGDFTQPTAPYTSGSTTVTAINNTMSAPSVMTGATSGAAGTSGLVPAPAAGDQAKYLTGAGTWEQPSSSVPTLHYITNQTGTSITIPDTSSARKVKVYKNGILLDRLSDNYSISGTTLTISPALELADTITLEVY